MSRTLNVFYHKCKVKNNNSGVMYILVIDDKIKNK